MAPEPPAAPTAPTEQWMHGPRKSKSCNTCKTRKIRCSGLPAPCTACSKRGRECIFGYRKIPHRKNVNKSLLSIPQDTIDAKELIATTPTPDPPIIADQVLPPPSNEQSLESRRRRHSGLYIDHLLAMAHSRDNVKDDQRFYLKGNGLFGGVYTLTFFSDSRLASLSGKLQNNRVDQLVQRISAVIKSRLKSPDAVSVASLEQPKDGVEPFADRAVAATYISTYFGQVHPLYPHLNRASFEATAFSAELPTLLVENKAFSALYHGVLALGCLHEGGGNFEPGKGRAWQLFSVSLALFRDLVQQPDSLLILQAMTTTAIYALGISCLGIERFVISEAARRAHNLSLVNLSGATMQAFRRTFWVLYSIEKMNSFYFGRTSDIFDADITTPIPFIPESVFGSFDWFLSFARLTRLLSRALIDLYSPGVYGKDTAYYLSAIEHLNVDLELWRNSIPEDVRPEPHWRQRPCQPPLKGRAVIWAHSLYFSFQLLLARTYQQIALNPNAGISEEDQVKGHDVMMTASRSILELMPFIDVDPCTPLWLLAGIPICALFVIFDEVLNNPRDQNTSSDLALLDMAGGHFSQIEYLSGGSLPTSLVAEFAHIAREYVNRANTKPPELQESVGSQNQKRLKAPKVQPSSDNALTLPDAPSNTDQERFDWLQTFRPGVGQNNNWLYNTTQTMSYQDPWTENDIFEGIDIMNIFNSFAPATNIQ